MAFEQSGDRVQEERQHPAVGLGDVKRALQGALGGALVTEGFPSGRLKQQRFDRRNPVGHQDGAVDDGREGGGGCQRIVLGEPQRGHGGAYLPRFPFIRTEFGEGSLGLLSRTRPDQGSQ